MSESSGEVQRIEENWNLFRKLCQKVEGRSDQLLSLIDHLGERLVLCPNRDRNLWRSCKPGGLIEFSLSTFKNMRAISKSLDWDTSTESMIVASLFHAMGKVGDLDRDTFLPNDSDWHIEKLGQLYKYDPDLQRMTVPHRSLLLLQHFSVNLSEDEWLAIATSQGPSMEENKFYSGFEPKLATLLQMAVRATNLEDKI